MAVRFNSSEVDGKTIANVQSSPGGTPRWAIDDADGQCLCGERLTGRKGVHCMDCHDTFAVVSEWGDHLATCNDKED